MSACSYYVYILASHIGGTLYIGVTNDLIRRVAEHRSKVSESFAKRYGVTRLVYFEVFEQIEQAIHREKRLKKMAAGLEDFTDREGQSELERSLSRDCRKRWRGLWNTGSPGQAGRWQPSLWHPPNLLPTAHDRT